jgi:6,7-dimethyl-8-ribityllumazine synthase
MAVFEGNLTSSTSLRFAIIIGRFNDLITDKLLAGCQDCLKRHGVDTNPHGTQVDYIWVPGSFEVPLMARQAALSHRYDAVICLGAVIRGQTPHFDYVASEVSKGIAAAGFETGVPVIFGIVTVDTMQQALERAGIKSNKGWDYALNALEMANLMQQFRGNGSTSAYSSYNAETVTTQALPIASSRTITPESAVEHKESAS